MKEQTQKQEFDDAYDGDLDSDGCWYCGGRRYYVSCIDDLCHGGDECIHGGGYSNCPECNRDGRWEWNL